MVRHANVRGTCLGCLPLWSFPTYPHYGFELKARTPTFYKSEIRFKTPELRKVGKCNYSVVRIVLVGMAELFTFPSSAIWELVKGR